MRIGIIVDGVSEYASLTGLYDELKEQTGHTILNPLLANLQPLGSIARIARTCRKHLLIYERKGVDRVVVILDRETRPECPGNLARNIAAEFAPEGAMDIAVVIKDRTFENWLIADLECLGRQRGRFSISSRLKRSVEPNKADTVDGVAFLKTAVRGTYDKVQDAVRIMDAASAARISANSRSFRRFLRCLEYQEYLDQSKRPAL